MLTHLGNLEASIVEEVKLPGYSFGEQCPGRVAFQIAGIGD